jgi:uncharacterized protein Yka (UPF0111/DUF47 family)
VSHGCDNLAGISHADRGWKKYLEQLEILGALIYECGSNLSNILADTMADRDKFASKIKDAERSAHDRSKQPIARLNRTSIKPLDQKTVRDLAVLLSEILHGIARAGNRFVLYQIGEPGAFLPQISPKLLRQATLINAATPWDTGDCPSPDRKSVRCASVISL